MTLTATATERELKVTDRCDGCGAQAFIVFWVGDTPLLLCGHHYSKHEASIMAKGYRVQDERHRIDQKEEGE